MEVFESLKANLVKMLALFSPEGEEPHPTSNGRLVKETEVIPVLLGNPGQD